MKNITKFSLIALFVVNAIAEEDNQLKDRGHSVKEIVQDVLKNEPKEISTAAHFKQMFTDAKVTGQIELMYTGHQVKNDVNPYATAIGGHLLYELAEYKGFNAGIEFSTVHDIGSFTGDKPNKHATNLSSSDGSYTEAT